MSWLTTRWIAMEMFQEASTPQDCESIYWDMFKNYAIRLICKKALDLGAGLVVDIAHLPKVMRDMWDWTGASADICDTVS